MTAFPETPFGAAERIDLPAVSLAVVRYEGIRLDDVAGAFDRGYAALGAVFDTGALTPDGPALAVYRGNPMETFDLEVAFPIAEPLTAPLEAGGARIEGSALPAGPAWATTHVGPYDQLGQAWGALMQRAAEQGAAPIGVSIESYVSDPTDTAPEQLRTDLIMPVGRADGA
ncbi:hypothetical protein CW368_02525 [Actinomycetales bacterium SN12]|nr:hypothetical protein CW368_02525 [Actinomycetales bacterium SN12]